MSSRSRKARAGHAEVTASIRDRISVGLNRIKKKMRAFSATAGRLGGALSGIAGGGAIALIPLINRYAAFDDQMRTVKAVTQANAKEFELLTEKSRELGRSTSFMASEVAGGQVALGRAGFKPKEIDESIESILHLARSTGTELPQAAGIGADVLRSFKLEASEMGRVSDVLSVTANSSSQTLVDLFESLKPVAPIAAEAGDSLEDLSAASGVLANNGIKGSLAGNSLARAYKNLANSQKQAKLKSLTGVDAVDAQGGLKPLVQIIQELGQATQGFGEAARLDAFEQLFGRGQVAALNLANANSGFEDLRLKLSDVDGASKATSEEMDAGIGGSLRKLMSAAESVGHTLITGLAKPLQFISDGAIAFTGYLERVVEQSPQVIQYLGIGLGVIGAMGGALLVMSAAGFVATGVMSFFGGIVALGTGIVTVFSSALGIAGAMLGFLISPIGLVTVAIVGGVAAWLYFSGAGGKAIGWIQDKLGRLLKWGKMVFGGIYDAIRAGDWGLAGKIAWTALRIAWQTGIGWITGKWIDFKFTFLSAFDGIVTGFRSKWNDVSTFIGKGIIWLIDQANRASEAISGFKVIDVDTESMRKMLDEDNQRFQKKIARDQLKRERNRQEQVENAKARLSTKALQEELKQLIGDAAAKRAAIDAIPDKDEKPGKTAPKESQRQQFQAPTLSQQKTTQSSLGSFSLSALAAFATYRSIEKRNADANLRTADATEGMLDELEDGGLQVT